ncbi:MAG: LysR family transcriptional regulator [Microbacterium sp.]|uniref:LysR family transcriptional regulator n=1 Tax=Microbacterium sp. TaxID=51671 RepID=UPI003A8925C0
MDELHDVDLNLLVVLDAILAERSLTRAAEVLGSTQPTVSGAVAKLRVLLDDPLLIRTGRLSELTDKARMLQPLVHSAVTEVEHTLNMRPMFDPTTSNRQFRLTASDYALSVMTAPLLDLLETEAPGVTVDFSPLTNVSPVDLLRDDVAVTTPVRAVPGRHQALFSDSMVCIASRTHPRLRGGAFALDDLAELPYVQVVFADGIVMYADDSLTEAGIAPRIARTVTGFLPVLFTVAGTDKYGFVPARLADMYADELDLAIVSLPLRLPVLVESVFWHPSRTDDPALRWLIDLLRRVAERVEFPTGA